MSDEGAKVGDLPGVGGLTPEEAGGLTPTEEPGLDRILTVPNLITLVRLACIPVFIWLLFGAHRQTAAAILLACLGATDWIDGFVARRFRQVSTLGKVLDPVADRVLVATAVITIIIHGAVPLWFGLVTLAREVAGLAGGAAPGLARGRANRCVVGGKSRYLRPHVLLSGLPAGPRHRRVAGADPGHRLGDRAHRPGTGLDRRRVATSRWPVRHWPKAVRPEQDGPTARRGPIADGGTRP